ncbi:autorepressor SdpR family transcription factor [Noviherbaspirillum sp.]|uniref:autorepressor SdpR family transcription factor n=1 Tax=Noviherbaspirillum sp. TaxID=1926288 RepID=UPI002D3D3D9C|nr:autorepressor SdpR family transcription factor [Noviherbaspirillum sp.]HZW20826.1 autorepressor SdpR family transcription factor [Noviherbaspirillum sp.]
MDSVFKALSDPTRRQILKLLRENNLSAGDIASHFAVSKPTISGHLSVLKEAGLVDVERHGNVLIYRLKLSVLEETMIPFMEFFARNQDSRNKKEKK